MAKRSKRFIRLCILAAFFSLLACAKRVDDPLKNTRKLVREGHGSLYNNGAFKVPYTSIRLIPPGPDTMELAKELAGIRAKESFSLSLKKAAESVDVVVEGTKDSYELAKKIHEATGRGADVISTEIGDRGTILVSKSYSAGKNIAVRSWEFSREKLKDLNRLAGSTVESFDERGESISGAAKAAGKSISAGSSRVGDGISEGAMRKGDEIAEGSITKGDEIAEGSIKKGDEIAEGSFIAGKEIIKWPARKGKEIIRGSIRSGDEIAESSARKGDEISEGSIRKGDEIISGSREAGEALIDSSMATARDIYEGGEARSKKAFRYGYEHFVQGYATLPTKLKKRGSSIGESLTKLDLWEITKEEWERAGKLSERPGNMVVETISGYPEHVSKHFREAKEEFTEGYKTSSFSFSMLKSMGLLLKALLWDATIEPAAKVTAGSLGYVGVNMVAFPSMVVIREGVATVEVAAEVTWNTARATYDIVAPTPIAAVASVYGVVDFTASSAVAGTTGAVGTLAGFTEKRGGEVAGVTVKGAGQVAGATTKGAGQVAGAAVKGAGTVAGATVMGAGSVAGAAVGVGVMGAGQVAGVATKGAGQVAGVTTKGAGQVAAVTFKGAGTVTGLAVEGTGKLAGLGVRGTGKVAGLTVKGAGYTAAGLQYIGVPVAAAGITVTGGTVGAAVGTAGGITGGTVKIVGETGAAATQIFGNTIAGTTLVGGTALSTAAGATVGVYQLSKAVVVPAGYELGSGIVLSYGTLSHLAAHSVLAVSDASYMVLSLEGPRWVLYAVKGDLGSGEELPVGTVLDLKKMQDEGEEIYYLPVSDEEMKAVVGSVYDNLPVATDSRGSEQEE